MLGTFTSSSSICLFGVLLCTDALLLSIINQCISNERVRFPTSASTALPSGWLRSISCIGHRASLPGGKGGQSVKLTTHLRGFPLRPSVRLHSVLLTFTFIQHHDVLPVSNTTTSCQCPTPRRAASVHVGSNWTADQGLSVLLEADRSRCVSPRMFPGTSQHSARKADSRRRNLI